MQAAQAEVHTAGAQAVQAVRADLQAQARATDRKDKTITTVHTTAATRRPTREVRHHRHTTGRQEAVQVSAEVHPALQEEEAASAEAVAAVAAE